MYLCKASVSINDIFDREGVESHFRRETFQNDGSRTHTRHHHDVPVRSKAREPLIMYRSTAS